MKSELKNINGIKMNLQNIKDAIVHIILIPFVIPLFLFMALLVMHRNIAYWSYKQCCLYFITEYFNNVKRKVLNEE